MCWNLSIVLLFWFLDVFVLLKDPGERDRLYVDGDGERWVLLDLLGEAGDLERGLEVLLDEVSSYPKLSDVSGDFEVALSLYVELGEFSFRL